MLAVVDRRPRSEVFRVASFRIVPGWRWERQVPLRLASPAPADCVQAQPAAAGTQFVLPTGAQTVIQAGERSAAGHAEDWMIGCDVAQFLV